MNRIRRETVLLLASILTLLGLALMVLSVLEPKPIPVVVGLSVGQGLGALGFALYAVIVGIDLWKARILDVPPPTSKT
jgi:hypothetical protein